MAVDVIRYPRTREAVVHRLSCHVWTTAPRTKQVSPVVTVDEGWTVRACSLCRPTFGIVVRERWHLVSRSEEMVRRFTSEESPRRRRRQRHSLDVPRGTVERVGWKRSAGCHSDDERLNEWLRWLFLSDAGRSWQTTVAKSLCEDCPVRGDCLVSAVWSEEPWGIWGGATVTERKALLKRWRREGRVDSRLPRRSLEVAVG